MVLNFKAVEFATRKAILPENVPKKENEKKAASNAARRGITRPTALMRLNREATTGAQKKVALNVAKKATTRPTVLRWKERPKKAALNAAVTTWPKIAKSPMFADFVARKARSWAQITRKFG